MLDLLGSMLNVITTLISFVSNTILSLISLITRIPSYTVMMIESINILPRFLIPYMLAYISIVVVQYILNRRAT